MLVGTNIGTSKGPADERLPIVGSFERRFGTGDREILGLERGSGGGSVPVRGSRVQPIDRQRTPGKRPQRPLTGI